MIDEKMHEKCGVFGVYGKGIDTARVTYFGLYALQHRGQESSGISVSDGKTIRTHKAMGLVTQVYSEGDLEKLVGSIAIGHNRYATSGGSFHEHTQPITNKDNLVTHGHNGNLPEAKELIAFLKKENVKTEGLSDSSLMQAAISVLIKKGKSLEEALTELFPLFTGAFCLLAMTVDKIAAVRDSFGIRPFSLGKLNGGYVFASETCALDTVGATYVRDIEPGEMVVIGKDGLRSYQLATSQPKLDIFEFVYFSRPDSFLYGKRVYEMRKNLGKALAKEYPLKADVVIPVPESSIPAAIGYAQVSGIPFDFGLVKNRYIWRTFIMPDQKLRDRGVHMKLNPIEEVIAGKRVVLVDDSIVRGTTARRLVKMVREAGATEVHLLSSSPPVKYPDFYGIATPYQKDLIGAQMTVKEIEKFITADSLYYLSYKSLIAATGIAEEKFCTSCFTGEYPIDIGENAKHIKKI